MYNHPKKRPATFTIAALIFGAACVAPLWAAKQTHYDLFQRVQEQVLRYSFFTVFDDVSVQIAANGQPVGGTRKAGDTVAAAIEAHTLRAES